jgi:hypothetical protein
MAEFEFYRPQVNALEQLWSKYVDTQAELGGAFARGLAPGLQALGKNIEARREREFQSEERKAKQTFDAGEAYKDRIARSAEFHISLGVEQAKTDAATAAKNQDATAKAAAELAEKDAEIKATSAVLKARGYEDPNGALATELGTPENAVKFFGQLDEAQKQAREQEERNAEATRFTNRKKAGNKTILEMQGSSVGKGLSPYLQSLAQELEDPDQIDDAEEKLEALSGRVAGMDWATRTVKEFEKVDLSQYTPTQRDIITTQMQILRGAATSFADKEAVKYFASNPQAFDGALKEAFDARNTLRNSLAGVGPEQKFWEGQEERGLGALRPQQKGEVVRMSRGVPVNMTPQQAAQLNQATAERVRKMPEWNVLMNSTPGLAAMPLGASSQDMVQFLQQRLSTSEAQVVLEQLQPLMQRAREEELSSRGFAVLKNLNEDQDLFKETNGTFSPTEKGVAFAEQLSTETGGDPIKMRERLKQYGLYLPAVDEAALKAQAQAQEELKQVRLKAQETRTEANKRISERNAKIDQSFTEPRPSKGPVSRSVTEQSANLSEQNTAVRNALVRMITRMP